MTEAMATDCGATFTLSELIVVTEPAPTTAITTVGVSGMIGRIAGATLRSEGIDGEAAAGERGSLKQQCAPFVLGSL